MTKTRFLTPVRCHYSDLFVTEVEGYFDKGSKVNSLPYYNRPSPVDLGKKKASTLITYMLIAADFFLVNTYLGVLFFQMLTLGFKNSLTLMDKRRIESSVKIDDYGNVLLTPDGKQQPNPADALFSSIVLYFFLWSPSP